MKPDELTAYKTRSLDDINKHWKAENGEKVWAIHLEKDLGIKVQPEQEARLGELFGPAMAEQQFGNIVRFMSGRAPSECPPTELEKPGSEKCIALVYEGVEAVRKIRDVLGPTDPSKAPPGSIRREFGSTVMINAAGSSNGYLALWDTRTWQVVQVFDVFDADLIVAHDRHLGADYVALLKLPSPPIRKHAT